MLKVSDALRADLAELKRPPIRDDAEFRFRQTIINQIARVRRVEWDSLETGDLIVLWDEISERLEAAADVAAQVGA